MNTLTLTNQQNLVCQARQIAGCLGNNQTLLMGVIIALFANATGMATDCTTLNNLAEQYACIPQQARLLVLIGMVDQFLSGGGNGGLVYNQDFGGNAPPFIPPNGQGVAFDTSTGQIWWMESGQWIGG